MEKILVTEGVEYRYFLNGQLVCRAFLVECRIRLTQYNSDRVSNQKLLDVPGAKIQEVRVPVPLTPPSGSGCMPKLIDLDAQYAYFKLDLGHRYDEWRIPVLNTTDLYILLDITKRERRSSSHRDLHNISEKPWELHPGTPGEMIAYH